MSQQPAYPFQFSDWKVVYGYGNFAIGLDPIFFHELHIQSISENLKL